VGVPVRTVGLDAYPPQNLGANATVSQLTAGWIKWFDKAPSKLRELTTIDELGIVATSGAYKIPYAWTVAGRYDPTVQTRWFTAACAAARASGIQGIYFWGMSSNQVPVITAGKSDRNSFVGRPSQSAITWCFQHVY
jgi:hypothetical protein